MDRFDEMVSRKKLHWDMCKIGEKNLQAYAGGHTCGDTETMNILAYVHAGPQIAVQ